MALQEIFDGRRTIVETAKHQVLGGDVVVPHLLRDLVGKAENFRGLGRSADFSPPETRGSLEIAVSRSDSRPSQLTPVLPRIELVSPPS